MKIPKTIRDHHASIAKDAWESLDDRMFYEAVGESHYNAAFSALYRRGVLNGDNRARGFETHLKAVLLPDLANQYDPNAVSVLLDGEHVGHVAREEAAEIRKAMGLGFFRMRRFAVVDACVWVKFDGAWRARVTFNTANMRVLKY